MVEKGKMKESVHFVQHLNNKSLERAERKKKNREIFQELKDVSFYIKRTH